MSRAGASWLGGALALGIAAWMACGGAPRPGPSAQPVVLELEAVDGGVIDTRSYRGRPLVLHLFTTWSLAAQADVAELEATRQALGDQVVIVGVALDPDGYALVAPWRRASGIAYLVGLGSPDLVAGHSALGRVTEVPTTVILAPDGTVAYRLERPLAAGELGVLLRGLLATR